MGRFSKAALPTVLTPSLSFDQLQSARGRTERNILDLITGRHFSQSNVWFNLLSGAIKGSWVNLPGNLFFHPGESTFICIIVVFIFPLPKKLVKRKKCWRTTTGIFVEITQGKRDLWILATASLQNALWAFGKLQVAQKKPKSWPFDLRCASSGVIFLWCPFPSGVSVFLLLHPPSPAALDKHRRLDWTNRL